MLLFLLIINWNVRRLNLQSRRWIHLRWRIVRGNWRCVDLMLLYVRLLLLLNWRVLWLHHIDWLLLRMRSLRCLLLLMLLLLMMVFLWLLLGNLELRVL